jgi:hypothetical protein
VTLNELIARVKVIATDSAGGEVSQEMLNTDVLIELILPRCLDVVVERAARTPDGVQPLRGEVVVAFVSGVGTLPNTIKEEHVETVVFKEDPATSYVPTWHEFELHPLPGDPPLDYSRFTVKGGQILYHQFDRTKYTFTGNRTIIALLRPALPTLIGDPVVIRDQILEQVIMLAASVVSGQTPVKEIGLDYANLETVRKRAPLTA